MSDRDLLPALLVLKITDFTRHSLICGFCKPFSVTFSQNNRLHVCCVIVSRAEVCEGDSFQTGSCAASLALSLTRSRIVSSARLTDTSSRCLRN